MALKLLISAYKYYPASSRKEPSCSEGKKVFDLRKHRDVPVDGRSCKRWFVFTFLFDRQAVAFRSVCRAEEHASINGPDRLEVLAADTSASTHNITRNSPGHSTNKFVYDTYFDKSTSLFPAVTKDSPPFSTAIQQGLAISILPTKRPSSVNF